MSVDAFDLPSRAEVAARSLTRLLDPRLDGLMYFLASWQADPPRAWHGLWDCGDGCGRHIDALTLARRMAPPGSPAAQPDAGEAQIEAWMMRLLGDDGLSWLPQEPWAEPWGAGMLLRGPVGDEPLAEISWAQRGTLLGLSSRYEATGDERYLLAGQRLVGALLRIAERHPDGLFFPEGYYRAGGWRHHAPGLCAGIEECNAAVVLPAVRFHAATGFEPAIELADGLVRFALRHTTGYTPDGRIVGEPGSGLSDHFHTRSNFILGVLELGIAIGRREYVAWARQSYEHAKEWGTDFGWFPEGLGCRHGEICCTVDMIEIAIGLGLHVDRAYFADAERFGRNHLLESQFLSLDRLREAANRLPREESTAAPDERFSTTEDVVESQLGAFAARSTLNDAFHLDSTAVMQCCNAAGTRGLYDLWRHSVHETGPGKCWVNLRFSVETPLLRVVSHELMDGRLDITAERDVLVHVRLPEGVAQAVVRRHGAAMELVVCARDGYVEFDAAAGSRTEVRYELPERVAHYEVGRPGRSLSCTGAWRGETLVGIDPPGRYHPLYQRSDTARGEGPA